MAALIAFNPYSTLSSDNSFFTQTQGMVQGVAWDDPTARMWLAEGMLASTETLPMWGGVPIGEQITLAGTGPQALGPNIVRATSAATTTGFSVFNQMGHMVITPGATVPLAGSLNSVGYYRLGTNQRIVVQADPHLVSTLVSAGTDLINGPANTAPTLYWNTTSYWITDQSSGGWALPTSLRILMVNTNSKVVSYNSGTGAVTWTTGDAALLLI